MCTKYEKPVVELNNSVAEGVYAASGNPYTLCASKAMPGFQEPNVNATTYIDYYGCSGCPQWRGAGADGIAYNHCSFEATADYDQADQADSYLTATNMPRWEAEGYAANATVENTNLW